LPIKAVEDRLEVALQFIEAGLTDYLGKYR